MLRDLRYGIRVLMQAKGWTTVVMLSLAIGIGANVAVFNVLNANALQELAVEDPGTIVRIRWTGENHMANDASDYGFSASRDGEIVRTTFSYPMLEHFRAANRTLAELAGSAPMSRATVVVGERAETTGILLVSGSYYPMLGVRAQRGRVIEPGDDTASAAPVAVISDRYWRTRFSGDAGVLGEIVHVNGVAVTIVGVLSPAFTGTQRLNAQVHDISVPLALDARIGSQGARLADATNWWVQVLGRRKPGISAEQVQGNLEGTFRREAAAGLSAYLGALPEAERERASNRERTQVPRLLVDSGSRGSYDAHEDMLRMLTIVGGVVTLVLLLVCVNVANLLLSRITTRERELSMRLSLGATRVRIVRQLLTESVLLAAISGALAMPVALWMLQLIPEELASPLLPDWRLMLFAGCMTALSGVACGVIPALRAVPLNVGAALKQNSRSATRLQTGLGRALQIVQISIAVILLVVAGLFMQTVRNLREVDLGFDPANLVFVRVNPDSRRHDSAYRVRYFQEGLQRLRAIPGVSHVTVSAPTLLSGSNSGTTFFVDGQSYTVTRSTYSEGNDINRVIVGPSYFATLGIPVNRGRSFDDRDHESAPRVAIINEAAAEKFFRDENAVGRRAGTSPETTTEMEIVGVVRDVRYNSLRQPPPPTIYLPYLQRGPEGLVFTIRTAMDPAALMNTLRQTVADVDRTIPIAAVETQVSQLEQRYFLERIFAQTSTAFGAIAAFIAAIGLFGIVSYGVSQRTREIGIRIAMGAERTAIVALVARECAFLVATGAAIGAMVSVAAGRLVASQLYGIQSGDTRTLLAAIGLMAAVGAAAVYFPTYRATQVNPVVALRYE